jgi:hypothetical protein
MMWNNVVNLSQILCQQVQLWKLYNRWKSICLHTIYAPHMFKMQILLVMSQQKKGLSSKINRILLTYLLRPTYLPMPTYLRMPTYLPIPTDAYLVWKHMYDMTIWNKFCNMMIDFHFKIFDVLKVFFKLMLEWSEYLRKFGSEVIIVSIFKYFLEAFKC